MKSVSVPDIGNFNAVEVIEVNVKVGDRVEKEDTLITLESEKASMELPSPDAGVIKAIKVKVGDKVAQGDVIIEMDVEGDEAPAEKDKPAKEQPAKQPAGSSTQEVRIPDIGNAKDVEVIEVAVKPGDTIEKEQTLITLESEKASMDVPSSVAGKVISVEIKVGDHVNAGDLILKAEVSSEAAPAATPPQQQAAQPQAAQPAPTQEVSEPETESEPLSIGIGVYASPAVRRLARELGVDLNSVSGTGRKGRIQKSDLHAFVKRGMSGGAAASGGDGLPRMPEVDFTQFGEVDMQPLSRIKKLSAGFLHRNWVVIPHVTQFDEADITELEAFRQSQKDRAEKQGFKLTPLVFLMKAVVAALKQYPQFNSSLSADGSQLVMKKYFHIGVAVDTPQGLVVPVIRNVDQKGLFELAKELGEVSQKARDGKLTAQEMQGSCFSISSLGGVGGTAFTPIVNAPDVAILGVSRSQMKPIYQDGEFVPRLMLPLSLSYDHRVIDGVEAARFTTFLSGLLADLRRVLL